jgi:hypothetical protein
MRHRVLVALALTGWALFGTIAEAQIPDPLRLRCEGPSRSQYWGPGVDQPHDLSGQFSAVYVLSASQNSFQQANELYDYDLFTPSPDTQVTIDVHANGGFASARRELDGGAYSMHFQIRIDPAADGTYTFWKNDRIEDAVEVSTTLWRAEGTCVRIN